MEKLAICMDGRSLPHNIHKNKITINHICGNCIVENLHNFPIGVGQIFLRLDTKITNHERRINNRMYQNKSPCSSKDIIIIWIDQATCRQDTTYMADGGLVSIIYKGDKIAQLKNEWERDSNWDFTKYTDGQNTH